MAWWWGGHSRAATRLTQAPTSGNATERLAATGDGRRGDFDGVGPGADIPGDGPRGDESGGRRGEPEHRTSRAVEPAPGNRSIEGARDRRLPNTTAFPHGGRAGPRQGDRQADGAGGSLPSGRGRPLDCARDKGCIACSPGPVRNSGVRRSRLRGPSCCARGRSGAPGWSPTHAAETSPPGADAPWDASTIPAVTGQPLRPSRVIDDRPGPRRKATFALASGRAKIRVRRTRARPTVSSEPSSERPVPSSWPSSSRP